MLLVGFDHSFQFANFPGATYVLEVEVYTSCREVSTTKLLVLPNAKLGNKIMQSETQNS